jgi:hypothetical protein
MQILTGHGIFSKYRRNIGTDTESRCWDCRNADDDAEHVLFVRPKWISKRMKLESFVGKRLYADNLVEIVLRKEENWIRFQEFCKVIRQIDRKWKRKRKRKVGGTVEGI